MNEFEATVEDLQNLINQQSQEILNLKLKIEVLKRILENVKEESTEE